MNTYKLASHNSWSYLPVRKWYMKPFAFVARCQSIGIEEQYRRGVRCFDLRLRWSDTGKRLLVHGMMEYELPTYQLDGQLEWLNKMSSNADPIYVRVMHDVRTRHQYTIASLTHFKSFCYTAERCYPNLTLWCGRNLYNWEVDYDFGNEVTCDEQYSSVCAPRWLDDWWPWLYARLNNNKILKNGTDKEFIMIDFV